MADPLPAGANPYVGPRTFARVDSERFFGREREAREILSLVISQRLVLFYAQSGAGKSSLLNALLMPNLEEAGFAVLPVARVGGEPPPGVAAVDNIYLFNLMLSLDQAGRDPGRLAHVRLPDFLTRLTSDDGEHYYYDETLHTEASPDAEISSVPDQPAVGENYAEPNYVLIVDQFEEFFTTHPAHWQEHAAFFAQLDEAMRSDRRLWVVLTLREDYVAALDPYAPLLTDKLRARYYMQRMEVDAALDAIRKPAELSGRPFAAGVVEKLTDDLCQVRVVGQDVSVSGQYIEPVQLQVVCFQLWERLQRGTEGTGETQITEADLLAAGDVNQALEQFYAETLAAVLTEPAVRAVGLTERALRTWFDKELITETGIRNTVFRNEAAGRTGTLTNVAVDALGRRFLLRTELRGSGGWVELVHDRLVEPIRVNNAAWFPQHLSTLQRQAALWNEQGRPSGLLLQNQSLTEAEAWAVAHKNELDVHERDFLEACRQARLAAERERRQSRTIRGLGVVAMGVALIALALLAVAVNSADRAKEAETTANGARATAVAERQRAEDRTTIAQMLLGVQRDFLTQTESRGLNAAMLEQQSLRLKQGTDVLDKGVAPRLTLPDVSGSNYTDALTKLDRACEPQPCLSSQVRWETSDQMAEGLVLRSDPPAGVELLWGTAVTLTVSQGPPLVVERPVQMELVPIPAGKFLMGSDLILDPNAYHDEGPQHTVNLPVFYIGKYEVTNAQYAAFVEATGHDAPWRSGDVPAGTENYPVVNVSWDDGVAFTEWLAEESGMALRLCTEAEWEKACRDTTGLVYPWADSFDASKTNSDDSGIGTTTPVGKYSPDGDSPYGVSDLAGNVWEWVSDWYGDYYENAPAANPQGPESGRYRALRGGSFKNNQGDARCANRHGRDPSGRDDSIGLRVCIYPGL